MIARKFDAFEFVMSQSALVLELETVRAAAAVRPITVAVSSLMLSVAAL